MTEFKIPELGENVAKGDVTRVLVNVGDMLAREQPVLELETDKATFEVPSSVEGVVRDIKVKAGDTVAVGAVVLTVEEGASGNGAKGAPATEAPPAGEAPPEKEAPPAGEAPPEKDAPPVTEQPPATEAPPARTEAAAGAREGGAPPEAPVRAAPADASPQHKVVSMPPRQVPDAVAGKGPGGAAERGQAAAASPAVRRLAREIGVEVHDVPGTGSGGRITQDDVKEHARRILSSVGAASGGAARTRALPDFEKWGAIDRQPWSNIRRTTAQHLSHAWTAIPHVTQGDKADITALEALRKTYREQVARDGGALTVTAMLVRVLATAVRRFPQFNASIDTDRGEIIYKKYVNVGVAVDTDRGLLVPVIRDADRKNITEIAIELQRLAERARERKLTLDDMSGGGITISNLGGVGGTYFTPIINWPEVAILGVSRAATEPVWRPSTGAGRSDGGDGRSGAFEPRLMLPLSLSYDHRVIDGADAMRFLRWVVEAVEQPFLLSLIG